MHYGKYTIYFDPPPISVRECDWHFYHDDYDGAEDANDSRSGHGPSLEDCKNQIDDLEGGPCKDEQDEVAQDGSCLRCGADQGVACRG